MTSLNVSKALISLLTFACFNSQAMDLAKPSEVYLSLDASSSVQDDWKSKGLAVVGAGAGLTLLWYCGKTLGTYFEKYVHKPHLEMVADLEAMPQEPRFEMMVQKSEHQVDKTASKLKVDEATRYRLNLTVQTNARIKESITSGNTFAKFRNVLLWGPAGSPKRMIAQELARLVHLDYYEISISLLQNIKKADISNVIQVFFDQKFPKSSGPALIYIDDAELLFTSMSEINDTHSILIRNALTDIFKSRKSQLLVVFGSTKSPAFTDDTGLLLDEMIGIPTSK